MTRRLRGINRFGLERALLRGTRRRERRRSCKGWGTRRAWRISLAKPIPGFEMFLIETSASLLAPVCVGARGYSCISKRGEKNWIGHGHVVHRRTAEISFVPDSNWKGTPSPSPPPCFPYSSDFPRAERHSLSLSLSFSHVFLFIAPFLAFLVSSPERPPFSRERCGAAARLGDADSYRPLGGAPHSGYMACHPEYYSTAWQRNLWMRDIVWWWKRWRFDYVPTVTLGMWH